jgi:hypothetical protein
MTWRFGDGVFSPIARNGGRGTTKRQSGYPRQENVKTALDSLQARAPATAKACPSF